MGWRPVPRLKEVAVLSGYRERKILDRRLQAKDVQYRPRFCHHSIPLAYFADTAWRIAALLLGAFSPLCTPLIASRRGLCRILPKADGESSSYNISS